MRASEKSSKTSMVPSSRPPSESGVSNGSSSHPSNSLRASEKSGNISKTPSSRTPLEFGTCNVPGGTGNSVSNGNGQDTTAGPTPKTPSTRQPSYSGNETASNYGTKTPSMKERTMAMAEGMSDVARSVGMAEDSSSDDAVSSDNSTTHIMYGLPADSNIEWENFERKLQDTIFTAALVKELKRCKDDTFAGTVRDILSSVLSNKIASEFSMCGSHGRKRSFKETTSYKTTLPIVMKKLYPNYTDKELKEATENWLRLAAQRSGGSKFKKYQKKVTIVTEEGPNGNDLDDPN